MSPLRKARIERELSIYQIAESVGVSAASISRMERRLQTPSAMTAAKLAALLGLTLEQILLPEAMLETVRPPGRAIDKESSR